MELRRNSILDFLEFGLLSPGDHFFDTYLETNLPYWPGDSDFENDDLEKSLYETLVLSIGEILKSNKCDSYAISGGADSRLILSILLDHFPHFLKTVKVYCRYHPSLSPEEDRDSRIVMALSEANGFDVKFESPNVHPQAYLYSPKTSQKYCLSGLFGGELLGATLLNNPIFDENELYQSNRQSFFCDSIKQTFPSLDAFYENHLKIRYLTLRGSSLSAFYESPTWIRPNIFLKVSATPFVNHKFLKVLFSCDPNKLKNHMVYSNILTRFCSKYLSVPVNNEFIDNKLNLGLKSWGKEPKLIPYNKQKPLTLSVGQKMIEAFIDTQGQRKHTDFLKRWLHFVPS